MVITALHSAKTIHLNQYQEPDDDQGAPVVLVSYKEAKEFLESLTRFFLQNSTDTECIELCQRVGEKLDKMRQEHQKQSRVTDFYRSVV